MPVIRVRAYEGQGHTATDCGRLSQKRDVCAQLYYFFLNKNYVAIALKLK